MSLLDLDYSRLSFMEQVALLSNEDRAAVLDGFSLAELMDPDLWLRPDQLNPYRDNSPIVLLQAGRGFGKLVCVTIEVPTPTGWTRMGALQLGDEVFDEQGNPCRVTAIYDSLPQRAWTLKFSDGTTLHAGGEHQWITLTARERKALNRANKPIPHDWALTRSPVVTDELAATQTYGKRGDRNHCIPVAGALNLPDAELPLDPWLLGYWLGNGSTSTGTLTTGSLRGVLDVDHVSACIASAGWAFSRTDPPGRNQSVLHVRGLIGVLRGMGVLNRKHVPGVYLRASVAQRVALVRGLMDSDGFAHDSNNQVEFCSTTKALAEGVLELVRSLSERPVMSEGRAMLEGRDMGPKYRVTWRPSVFNPFALPRKASRIAESPGAQGLRLRHRMIESITPAPIVPMRCITVDSPSSMYLVGRAMIPTHNTRVGASWVIRKAREDPGCMIHLIGRTVSDARDVMVRGPAGILAASSPDFMPTYVPSLRRLVWPNGSTAMTFSALKPSQLRGPQCHYSWGDELAAWSWRPDDSGATAWDHVKIGTRLGRAPQVMVTTTPKRIAAIRELVREGKATDRVSLHSGSTMANRANLSPEYLRNLFNMYAGTALERQELYGELLDIVEGALWRDADIATVDHLWLPVKADVPTLSVVGVDPGMTTGGDATGIITVRATQETALTQRRAVVVADWTEDDLQPERWAARVVEAWRVERDLTDTVPIVVAEKNAGGEMIAAVIEGVAGENVIPIALVPANRSKAARAEPIVLAYRQGRVKHLLGAGLESLEEELTGWEPPTPGGARGSGWSPNRLDACVHALRALMVDDKPLRRFGRLEAQEPSQAAVLPLRRRPPSTLGAPWRDPLA